MGIMTNADDRAIMTDGLREILRQAVELADACELTLVAAHLEQTLDVLPGPRHLI
jgi:hypothetical protein